MKFSCICQSEKNQKWILYESPFEGKQEPGFRDKRNTLADRATSTRCRAAVCNLGLRAPGRRISFFAYAQKTKPFTGPLQNGSVNLGNGNICYVSMNHLEAATATEQQKGIAQKRNPPAHQKRDHIYLIKGGGVGGGIKAF
jgi:hypothetical protein